MQFLRFHTPLLACLLASASSLVSAQPPAPPPPPVSFVTVAPRDVPVSFDFVGVTEASKMVEVRSRVRGFLESRDFEEGTVVEKGTRLYLIDPKPFEADLEIAKARVAQAQASLDLAEQEVARMNSVKVPGAIALSDLDKQVADKSSASASLNLAKAELAKAQLELGYTTVEAPLTGLVGKTLKEIGSFVDEGSNGLLTVMHQVDPIYVSYQMTERDYLSWRKLAADGGYVLDGVAKPYLEITLLDGTTYPLQGTIDYENTVISTSTGSVELRATFGNKDRQLKPGQFVRAHMLGYLRPNTLAVPQRAVSESPQGAFVYVVKEDNTAAQRFVQLGQWSGADWIIESGLEPGDKVIVDGHLKVQPGVTVDPSPLAATPEANAAGQEQTHAG